MIDLEIQRRFLAEEIAVCHNLRTPALVEALATVPREAFLRPGPWIIRGEGDMGGPPRQTPDANPAHVIHNVSVGIDPARQLFNGAPSVVATAIDALDLRPGHRVLHIGCGLGYFSALMAYVVGPAGRVLAIEVDAALAEEARGRLASTPAVQVRQGNGAGRLEETFDAILVNAGVTHARDEWLDALTPGGRLVLPLTATMGPMGPIGKGPMLRLTHAADGSFEVRLLTLVAIYSATDLRDDTLNAALGRAMTGRGLVTPVTRLRRDLHEPSAACWLHGPTSCFSTT